MWNGEDYENTPEYSKITPPKKETNQTVTIYIEDLPRNVKENKISLVFKKHGDLIHIKRNEKYTNIQIKCTESFNLIKTIRINGSTYRCTCNFD
jgi:hypothetical protein